MHFEFIKTYNEKTKVYYYSAFLVKENFYRAYIGVMHFFRKVKSPEELQRRAMILLDVQLEKPIIKEGINE